MLAFHTFFQFLRGSYENDEISKTLAKPMVVLLCSTFFGGPRARIAEQNRSKSMCFIAVLVFLRILRIFQRKSENRQNHDFELFCMTNSNDFHWFCNVFRFSCKNDEIPKTYRKVHRFGTNCALLPG